MPGFEPGISCLLDRRFNLLSHRATFKIRQWVKIILKNKQGKHNYKPKNDLKMRHCPDLKQGSPVY